MTTMHRVLVHRWLLLAPMLLLGGCSALESHPPLETVEGVDLLRYEGVWYEIAAFPQRYERGCHCTTAEYRAQSDDRIEVINRCRDGDPRGELRVAEGKAFPVKGSGNAKLEVQFFWPFRGDYWVLALGDDYDWSLVGSPDRDALWILARTPRISPELRDRIERIARTRGFDVGRLEDEDQSCFIEGPGRRAAPS